MLVVKVIKKLQALVAKLKAKAIACRERQLHQAAQEVDDQVELAEKRIKFSQELQRVLEDRAYEKLEQGVDRANEDKKRAGQELDELNKL